MLHSVGDKEHSVCRELDIRSVVPRAHSRSLARYITHQIGVPIGVCVIVKAVFETAEEGLIPSTLAKLPSLIRLAWPRRTEWRLSYSGSGFTDHRVTDVFREKITQQIDFRYCALSIGLVAGTRNLARIEWLKQMRR